VQDCAVIGVPDDEVGRSGQGLRAAEARTPRPSADVLIAWCKDQIGSMKAPKSVDFVVQPAAQPGRQGAQA
jgi:acyl-CoA synthetase (AMP-forming)/AMP-acid ligase II